jgi:hypothetical protein
LIDADESGHGKDKNSPRKKNLMPAATNSNTTISHAKHRQLSQLLHSIHGHVVALNYFQLGGDAARILNQAALATATTRVAMSKYRLIEVDFTQLNCHGLRALKSDPGVPRPVKRLIDLLLKIRILERRINRAMDRINPAEDTGAIDET